ncbi:MAG TPA: sugar ABC transporter substrate-binding protein [Caldilineaceae bacterium]|nr:sugar ABC transporter substrate-binding protein [Caldilineaceae bacterium]
MTAPLLTRSPMTRRAFVRWLAGATTTGLLAACTPAVSPQGSAEGSPAQATVELSFDMYNFDPWLRALDEMFQAYGQENPGVVAQVESAPWEEFWPRQEARLAAGNPSDLSIGDPQYFGRYAHKGYYLDLESYIERDQVALDQWFEVTVNDCRYDRTTGIVGQGALFGMPATYVGMVLYYNKDLLDAAGESYPDDTWDRERLFQAAVALTQDSQGNNAGAAGFDPEDITQWGINMIGAYGIAVTVWNNGGELINREQTQCLMTEPEAQEMFEWLASLLHEHHVHPTPAQLEGVPNPFQVGRVAITMDGTWNVDYYAENLEFNWDIAPVPLGTKGLERVTYAGTNTLHIFSNSAHLEEAWDLLQYMVGPGGMAYFAKTGTPSLIETANSDVYLTGEPENRQEAVNIGNYARNYYPGLKSDQWKQIYNAELEALWIGQSSAAEVLQTICDKITPILETPVEEL